MREENGSGPESLGALLKRARLAIPMSLRAVEDATEDITNGYLSQIESGQIKRPSPNVLYQLANLYGLMYRELLRQAGHRVPGDQSSEVNPEQLNGIPLRALADLSDEERSELTQYIAWLKSRRQTK